MAQGQRCIYCAEPATTVEHMPPRSMFQGKRRPSGMEFPCCATCNNGTSVSDLVAGFFARISPLDQQPEWKIVEARDRVTALDRKAPGVLAEFFDRQKFRQEWLPGSRGILTPRMTAKAEGPLIRAYLDVFAAKFGMALYREHCGAPIPTGGGVLSAFFLNAGLSQQTANKVLAGLPSGGTLVQSQRNSAHEQFFYRFNTDERSIVGALARFHDGLYVLTIAFSDLAMGDHLLQPPRFRLARPGELEAMMPAELRITAAAAALRS